MPVRVRFPSRVPGGLLRVLLFLYSGRESFNRWRLGRVICTEVCGRRLLRNLRHWELSSLKTSFQSPIPNTANLRLRLPSSACSALICGGRSSTMVFVVSCEFRMWRSLVIWQITFNRWRLGRVVCARFGVGDCCAIFWMLCIVGVWVIGAYWKIIHQKTAEDFHYTEKKCTFVRIVRSTLDSCKRVGAHRLTNKT